MFTCDSCYKNFNDALTSYRTHYDAEYELCGNCLEIFIQNDRKGEMEKVKKCR